MTKALLYIGGAIVAVHGAIHLLGFFAYFPLTKIAELPYKTVLAGGRWEVGALGMKLYAILWLLATLGFLLSVAGLFAHQSWWRPMLVGTMVLSTAIIALDWAPSFRGAIINVVILAVLAVVYFLPGGAAVR